jgi:hypothetical protein
MKYSIPASSYLLQSLKDYDKSVTDSLPKAPKIPLPPSVTSRDSTGLTEEYGSTPSDYEHQLKKVEMAESKVKAAMDELMRLIYNERNSFLFKITIQGSLDEQVKPLSVDALSILKDKSEPPVSRFIMRTTAGLASLDADPETL